MLLRLCVALLLALGAGGLPLGRAGISPSPPTRTPVDRSPPGEGSFSGYRQLDSSESGRVAVEWRRRMGVISGNTNIELYELICLLEEFSLALPGAKPHRRELMALAEFEDGLVKTVALAYCVKVKCPWELTVSGILSSPLSDEPAGRMVDFIRELCKDNAIWPDFAPLARWSAFQDKPYVRESEQQRLLWTGQVQPAYIERGGGAEHERLSLESLAERSRRYSEANRAPSIILDNHDIQVLPAFWFRVVLSSQQPLYFRQRRSSSDEFEVRFEPPVTGVSSGSGTVGACVVVEVGSGEHERLYLPAGAAEQVRRVSVELQARVVRPDGV